MCLYLHFMCFKCILLINGFCELQMHRENLEGHFQPSFPKSLYISEVEEVLGLGVGLCSQNL